MKRQRTGQASLLMWAFVASMVPHNLVIPVMSAASSEDQKNFFFPDPHAGTPPTISSPQSPPSPPHSSGGSSGSSGTPAYGTPPTYGTPPSYGTPPTYGTPSHGSSGGSSHGGKPPSGCETPPSKGGGHKGSPSQKPPKGSSGSSGGYYNSPPSPSSSGGGGGSTTPPTQTPPKSSVPSPPYDPNSPFTGTCNFWKTHPDLIWGLFGWWGTVGGALGAASLPGFGTHMTLQQALSNTRTDGLGELYREGTASLLNSMVNKKFPYTTKQVRDSFLAAMSSDKTASDQAHLFQLANEGRVKA